MAQLTEKQAAFVDHYMITLNATQSCIKAGYSKKGARTQGSVLLANPNVQAELQKRMAQRADELKVDQHYVLKRLVEIDQMDVLDIMNDDCTIKPIHQWPLVWRRSIMGIDVSENVIRMDDGTETLDVTVLKKIRWPDKIKNLELLGRHTQVRCWETDITLLTDGIEMNLHYGARKDGE